MRWIVGICLFVISCFGNEYMAMANSQMIYSQEGVDTTDINYGIRLTKQRDILMTQNQKRNTESNSSLSTPSLQKELVFKSTNIDSTPNLSKAYLSLKDIVYPMPDKYAKTYLMLKTLKNPAQKYITVYINKRKQRMSVYLNDEHLYYWKVSTARRGYWTPVGHYRPQTLERMHYSRKYHNSPMPYSVFFKGGYAIHGTRSIRRLGRPASHGCIRLHPRDAKKLYYLIKRYGKYNTRIVIKG